ncbi:hypothetical protein R1sor_010160 [Riccia sorocarpa]|uniref:Fungal lipase-type domain-containing protein n=1 Tax=Riccia sorocarpa TaxID=122646 RepID=A0ABD3HZ61_9MARC
MTGTATCESLINDGPNLKPDPRVVARAALCATASYSREAAAKSFIGFEHLDFLNVIAAPSRHEVEAGSRSRVGNFREVVKRKMGMHRENQSQGMLVASAQAENSDEVEVYVAFRGVASWEDIFDDADCSQASLLGFGDIFEGEVKGKFHNGFSKHLTNNLPEVNDLYDYANSAAITGGKKVARLVFCGHSLGGAISHLAMLALFMTRLGPEDVPSGRYMSIGFGSPHIGDQRAAELFNSDFPVGRVLFTMVHRNDPVPFLLDNFPTKIKGATVRATPQATEAMRKLTSELRKLGTITEMEEADSKDASNLSCIPMGHFVHSKSAPSNVTTPGNIHRMIMDARSSMTDKESTYAHIGQYLRLTQRKKESSKDDLAADLLSTEDIKHIANKLAFDSNCIKAHHMSAYLIHLCPKVDALQVTKSVPGLTVVPDSSLEPVIKSAFLAIQGSDSAEIRVSGKNLGLVTRGGWNLRMEEPAYSFSSLLSEFYEFDDSNLQAERVNSPGDVQEEYVLKMRVQLPEEVKDAALYKVSLNRGRKLASVGLKLAATSFGRSVQSNVMLDPRSFLLEPHSPLLSSLRKAMEKLLVITDAFSNSDPTTRKIYDSVLLGVKYGLPDHADVLARILLSDKPLHAKQEQLFTDFFVPVDKLLCEALISVRKHGHLRRFRKSVAGYRNVIEFLAKFCKEPSKFPDEILTFESMVPWSGLSREDKPKETYETLEEKILNYMPTGLADELKSGGQGSTSFESSLSVKESVFAEKTSSDILRWLRVLFGLRLVQQAIEKVPMVALVGANDVSEDTLNHLFGVDESVTLQHKKNVHFVEDGSTKLFVVHFSDSDLPIPGCSNNRLGHKKENQLSVVKSFDLCIVLVRSVAERPESEIREAFPSEFMTSYKKRCANALIDKGSSDRVKFCHIEDVNDRPKEDALNQCGILCKHEIFSKIKTLLKLSGPSRSTAAGQRTFTLEDLTEGVRSEHKKFDSISSNSGFGLLSGYPAADHSLTR